MAEQLLVAVAAVLTHAVKAVADASPTLQTTAYLPHAVAFKLRVQSTLEAAHASLTSVTPVDAATAAV